MSKPATSPVRVLPSAACSCGGAQGHGSIIRRYVERRASPRAGGTVVNEMATRAPLPRPRWSGPQVGAVAGTACAVVLIGLPMAGDQGFATDPVGACALAAGAILAAVAHARLTDLSPVAARASGWLAWSLVAYLACAVAAVLLSATASPAATAAVAVWNTAWIPPVALMQLTASAAVRGPGTPWTHVVLVSVVCVSALANLLLSVPGDPFAGLPTIAPEAWRTRLSGLGDAATIAGAGATLLIPIALWRAALTSRGSARAHLGVAAAGATAAPLVIAFCLLLAVAREPGAVDPALGSVAFLVALGAGTAMSSACAVLAARGAVSTRRTAAVVRGVVLAAGALVVAAGGTLIAAPSLHLAPTAVALLIAALTLAAAAAAWVGAGSLGRALVTDRAVVDHAETDTGGGPSEVPVRPAPAAAPTSGNNKDRAEVALTALTPRENEVLALLAEGASNAGIAAALVVSERTVDAHLRSIFTKLGLERDSAANRRVRAARIWLDRVAVADGPRST
ncbi:helix-turn-helix transcriptional regulator [Georgenia sp. TF02-10]|uniref:helix-turn-helix transcriptional regulator n=1 Tax=Georgenia sp. TF02-10 TaxID=2917725 RepID=UPI001FA715D1|nr:helix-turn-helix transcriptional regulator [Georgenia sp. TF02-10]UNX53502.1 helix-turn-helix transcriptional regulator [Georgenia sp. TF02-10]